MFPTLLSRFFMFRRMFRKSLRILVEVISIPTAPTKGSVETFAACTGGYFLLDLCNTDLRPGFFIEDGWVRGGLNPKWPCLRFCAGNRRVTLSQHTPLVVLASARVVLRSKHLGGKRGG